MIQWFPRRVKYVDQSPSFDGGHRGEIDFIPHDVSKTHPKKHGCNQNMMWNGHGFHHEENNKKTSAFQIKNIKKQSANYIAACQNNSEQKQKNIFNFQPLPFPLCLEQMSPQPPSSPSWPTNHPKNSNLRPPKVVPRDNSALQMFAKSTKARKVPASPLRAQ